MKYYEINEETARLSHEMMSMSDYRKNSATAGYRAAVDEAAALVEKQKQKVSPFYHDKLDGLLDLYARRLAQWTNDHNRNGASCPSVLICGPANFPTKKKARQNARELLEDRLKSLQSTLETGKAMNAYYRKNKTMKGFRDFSDAAAADLDKSISEAPSFARRPFPDYSLTSLRGKIKRVQENLAKLDKMEAAQGEPDKADAFDGGRVVHNVPENRLQIFFDEIPDEETRSALKSHGFRWSRKNQAWQRQLTRNAVYDARRLLNISVPTEESAPSDCEVHAAKPDVSLDTPDGMSFKTATAEDGQILLSLI